MSDIEAILDKAHSSYDTIHYTKGHAISIIETPFYDPMNLSPQQVFDYSIARLLDRTGRCVVPCQIHGARPAFINEDNGHRSVAGIFMADCDPLGEHIGSVFGLWLTMSSIKHPFSGFFHDRLDLLIELETYHNHSDAWDGVDFVLHKKVPGLFGKVATRYNLKYKGE